MSEAATLQRIRLALGTTPGLRLFRNSVGMLRDQHGTPVRFGLHPGSADLIGWRSVTITPEHVGQTLALFASVEVKAGAGKARPDQILWAEQVRAAGGLSGIAYSPEQARLILGLPEP